MIRSVAALSTLALTVAFTAPASAESSVRLSLTGKSANEAYAMIVDAARTVCRGSGAGDIHGLYTNEDCVRDTIAAGVKQANIPALTQYARTSRTALTLASN